MNRDLIESLGFSPRRENLVFLAGSVVGGDKTKGKRWEFVSCEKERVGRPANYNE